MVQFNQIKIYANSFPVCLFLSNSALERITGGCWITKVDADYMHFSGYSEVCWNSQTFGQKHIYSMTQPSDNCSISRYLKRKNKASHLTHSFIFLRTSEMKMCTAFALRKHCFAHRQIIKFSAIQGLCYNPDVSLRVTLTESEIQTKLNVEF